MPFLVRAWPVTGYPVLGSRGWHCGNRIHPPDPNRRSTPRMTHCIFKCNICLDQVQPEVGSDTEVMLSPRFNVTACAQRAENYKRQRVNSLRSSAAAASFAIVGRRQKCVTGPSRESRPFQHQTRRLNPNGCTRQGLRNSSSYNVPNPGRIIEVAAYIEKLFLGRLECTEKQGLEWPFDRRTS